MSENNDISKEIKQELEALSPNLSKIPKKLPYSVPEGYFEGLGNQAAEMAQDIGVQRTPIIRRLISIRSAAVAASIMIIGMLVWINHLDKGHQDLAEVSVDEMIEYLEDESTFGMDEEELVDELLSVDTIFTMEEFQEDVPAEATVEGVEPIEVTEEEVTDEDIIEYLLEDNIDLATIIDEL